MSHDVDIAILGCGPAASAAALTLAHSPHRALVIAPASKGGDRPGESLAASGVELLQELRLGEAFAKVPHRSSDVTYSAWGAALLAQSHAILNPVGAAYVIDRPAFDRMLYDALTSSIPFLRATIRSAARQGDGWELILDDGRRVSSRFIIDCSGATAIGARTVSALRREDRLVAAYAFLAQKTADVEATPATMIEAVEYGWWYATLLPDRRISIALFSDPECLPNGLVHDLELWKNLIAETLFIRKWLESAEYGIETPPNVSTAGTTWLETVAGENWAAAGDAAAALDPLSSHGLSTALWSGHRAAFGSIAALDGDQQPLLRYAEQYGAAVRSILQQRTRVYAQERRFAHAPFWRKRSF